MEHRLSSIEDRLDAIEEHLHLKRKRHGMEEKDVPAPRIRRPLPGIGNMTGVGDGEVRLMAEFLPHPDAAKLKDTSAKLNAAVPAVPTYPLGLCLLQQYNDDPFANAVRDAAAIIIGAVGYEVMRASLNPTERVYLERVRWPRLGAQVPLQSLKMMKGNLRWSFTGDPNDLIRTLRDEIPILPDVPSLDEYSRITALFWCKGEEAKELQNEYKSIQRLLKSNIDPQQNAKAKNEGLEFKFEVYTDLDGKSIVVTLRYIYNRKNRGETLHQNPSHHTTSKGQQSPVCP